MKMTLLVNGIYILGHIDLSRQLALSARSNSHIHTLKFAKDRSRLAVLHSEGSTTKALNISIIEMSIFRDSIDTLARIAMQLTLLEELHQNI